MTDTLKKILCVLIAVAFLSFAGVMLTACDDEPTAFTVTFDLNYEGASDAPAAQSVKSGEKVTEPTVPVRNGYIFGGWFKDKSGFTPFKFDTAVTSDLTVYAKWTQGEIKYTVVFDLGYTGAADAPATQTVLEGDKVEKPADPVRTGYVFGGWYTDSAYTSLFDFNNAPTSDLTLRAKWIEGAAISVTYDYNYDSAPDAVTVSVAAGGKAAKPDDPVRDGSHVFNAWYTDENFTQVFDFNAAVTQDVTLYANWTALLEAEYTDLSDLAGAGYSANPTGTDCIVTDNGVLGASNDHYVSYLYLIGCKLVFDFESDRAAENVKLVMRVSSEVTFKMSGDKYLVKVNGEKTEYAEIPFYNGQDDKLAFVDLVISENVKLKAGKNRIELVTNVLLDEKFGAMEAGAPMVDCIKLTAKSDITWDPVTTNIKS